jgi:hypothetical protein
VNTGLHTDRAEHERPSARRTFAVTTLVAMLAFGLCAGIASAAAPTKNALYSWTGTEHTSSGPRLFKVELHVGASGKTATAAFYCGPDAATIALNAFPVATNGSYNGEVTQGNNGEIWGLKGTFTNPKTATATVHTGQYNTCNATVANYKVKLTTT